MDICLKFRFLLLLLKVIDWPEDYALKDPNYATLYITYQIERAMFDCIGTESWYSDASMTGIEAQINETKKTV